MHLLEPMSGRKARYGVGLYISDLDPSYRSKSNERKSEYGMSYISESSATWYYLSDSELSYRNDGYGYSSFTADERKKTNNNRGSDMERIIAGVKKNISKSSISMFRKKD